MMSAPSYVQLVLHSIAVAGVVAKRRMTDGVPREEALGQATALFEDLASETEDSSMLATYRALSHVGASLGDAWAECAFASVRLSPRLAASLVSTSLPKEYVTDVLMPWRCFAVHVEAGLFGEGEAVILACHALGNTGKFWTVTVVNTVDEKGGAGLSVGCEPSLSDFVALTLTLDSPTDERKDSLVRPVVRAVESLHRLFVGLCVEMANRPPAMPPPGWPLTRWGTRRSLGEPNVWAFKLMRDVRVDCRDAVTEYVREGRRSPVVRSLVRGHFKRQPCGPRGEQRRWIHVEPYWRGQEDGPIAVRSHVVGPGGPKWP